MTEEERTREVQRISERSSRSVKVPRKQQRSSGSSASRVGTLQVT